MTFESRIVAFADRFLSQRACDLIVEPSAMSLMPVMVCFRPERRAPRTE